MSYQLKVNEGSLFANKEKREGRQDADATGSLLVQCPCCGEGAEFWLNAWTNVAKDGKTRYQKIKANAKEPKKEPKKKEFPKPAVDPDDKIPF